MQAPIDVRCDRVSKCYRVRRPTATAPRTPARMFSDLWPARQEFWALREATFEIARGRTLGVVGRNGAGKSTLLKLLGGITVPSEGEITIAGTLAALIEVGSGFHPELTGRENVFLSGAILGMRRRDIAARLDSIADFSGVATFLDTPVKFYSSGMYVRLGFAIAAHLEPDVLLVDEVLAVGDAEFQARCLQRIQELKRRGTTMVLVSHDLGAIEHLADRALLVDGGRVTAEGAPHDVITAYQRLGLGAEAVEPPLTEQNGEEGGVRIESLTLHGEDGTPALTATTGDPLIARVRVSRAGRAAVTVTLAFYDFDRGTLLAQCTGEVPEGAAAMPPTVDVDFVLPQLLLAPGVYTLGAAVTPRGAAQPAAWRYGRTTLYVEGTAAGRGVFTQPFECRLASPSPMMLVS